VKQNYIFKLILLHEIQHILSANGKIPRECNNFRVNEFLFWGERIFVHPSENREIPTLHL